MMSTAPGRSLSPSAWALFALVACGLVVPSEARAGCAPYVLSRSDRDQPVFLDPLLLGAGDMSGEHSSPLAPADDSRRRPCSGAFCSGEPSTPPTPSSSEGWQVKPWACLAAPAVPTGRRLTLLLVDPSDSRPVRAGISIFHPPRPTSSPSAIAPTA